MSLRFRIDSREIFGKSQILTDRERGWPAIISYFFRIKRFSAWGRVRYPVQNSRARRHSLEKLGAWEHASTPEVGGLLEFGAEHGAELPLSHGA